MTVTATVARAFWFTFTVPGTEQVVPIAAALQVIVANPVNPAPPMDKLYEAA